METHKNQRLRYSQDVRSVHSGGNLNNGSQAGVSSRNSNNGLGNSNSNNGSQLSYLQLQSTNTKPCLLAKHKKSVQGFSSSMQGLSNKVAKSKKLGRIYPLIYDKNNIKIAFKNAMKDKSHYSQVKKINKYYTFT